MEKSYVCRRCGHRITAYRKSTSSRRKCSKCGSYQIAEPAARNNAVSIIIVNHNGKQYLADCLNSLAELDYPETETILVDNKSSDDSIQWVDRNFPSVKILRNTENNYCRALNMGIASSASDYIVLLNNDTRVEKSWLTELMKPMHQDQSVGACGSKILLENGRINSTGHVEYPNMYWADRGFSEPDKGQYDRIEEVGSLCGVAVLYRRACLADAGPFDEDFVMYCEDVDMSIRCRNAGWRLLYVPKSVVHHKYNGTGYILCPENPTEVQRLYVERNRLLLVAKHYPQRLAEAMSSSAYFYIQKRYDLLYGMLHLIFAKLISHHPKSEIDQLLPDFFSNLRKIIAFERDSANVGSHLSQELKKAKKRLKLLKQKCEQTKHRKEVLAKELEGYKPLKETLDKKSLALERSENENRVMINQLHELKNKLDLANASASAIENKLESANANVRILEQKYFILEKEYEVKKRELADKETEVQLKTDQMREFQHKLQIKEKDISDFVKEINNLRDTASKLSAALDAKSNDLVSAKKEKSELNDNLRCLQKKITALTEKNEEKKLSKINKLLKKGDFDKAMEAATDL
ncbi:MAG: glycosyltransferase [archaeon]